MGAACVKGPHTPDGAPAQAAEPQTLGPESTCGAAAAAPQPAALPEAATGAQPPWQQLMLLLGADRQLQLVQQQAGPEPHWGSQHPQQAQQEQQRVVEERRRDKGAVPLGQSAEEPIAQQQQQEQQQEEVQLGAARHRLDQYDTLLMMLKFGEQSDQEPLAAPTKPACTIPPQTMPAAVKAEPATGSAAACLPPPAPMPAPAAATAAGAAQHAQQGASKAATILASTLADLGLISALTGTPVAPAACAAGGSSGSSSGTQVVDAGLAAQRMRSQDSVSDQHPLNADHPSGAEQPQPLGQAGSAPVHEGGQDFAAILSAAAAAAAEEADEAEGAGRRARRVRAAKRRADDMVEGSDWEPEEEEAEEDGPGAGVLGAASKRAGPKRRKMKVAAPQLPKGERKCCSTALSIAMLEAEGCFDMRLDDAARHLGFGSPTSIKKAMGRLNILKWPNRTRETARNVLAGLEGFLVRFCAAGTCAAAMAPVRARLQPHLACTTALELPEDLRRVRQKVYKLRDQEASGTCTGANLRRCVQRLAQELLSEGFASGVPPAAAADAGAADD